MYSGHVKSFAPSKGYGFIGCDDIDGDVFFMKKNLPLELQSPEVYGRASGFQLKDYKVAFDLVQTADGKQQGHNLVLSNPGDAPYIGTVKSWNGQKGYGFLTSSMWEGKDIFFGDRSLPPELRNAPLIDRKASFSVSTSEDGKPRAENLVVLTDDQGPPPQTMHQMSPMRMHQMSPMRQQMPVMMHPGLGGQRRPPPAPMHHAPPMMPPQMMGRPDAGSVADGQECHGIVKQYMMDKGYGFIRAHGCPQDIYFKAEGQWEAGMNISFVATIRPDGKVAAKDVQEGLQEGRTLVGTVKSYSQGKDGKGKGFGFIVVPNQTGDIYFNKAAVPPHLQEADLKGMTVQFTVGMTPDGKPMMRDGEFLDEPPAGYSAPSIQQKRPAAPSSGGYGQPLAKRQMTPNNRGGEWNDRENSQGHGNQSWDEGWGQKGGGGYGGGGGGGARQMTGTVKSYSGNKGFGFIVTPEVAGDIYFKGQYPDMTGREVSFRMIEMPDGKAQAQNVRMM